MDWYTRLDITHKILGIAAALVVLVGTIGAWHTKLDPVWIIISLALVGLLGATWILWRRLRPQSTPDLQKVMYRSSSLALGAGPSRIFHAQWPYVLPVCFKSPKRPEYVYIVVGKSTDDESRLIITEPGLAMHNIISVQAYSGPRWYQLNSDIPLRSIRFDDGPRIEDFVVVKAEIFPKKG